MKKGRVVLGIFLGLVIAVGLYFVNRYWIAPATTSAAKPTGQFPEAPGFSATSLSGEKIDMKDYRGKVVLLDFWATWCGPCRMEIPGFVELQKKYRDQGFAVIGVSMDDGLQPVREFYNQFHMNYPVVMGSDKMGELYGGIMGLPTSFVIGRDGRIYAKHVGATEVSVFESEIRELLAASPENQVGNFKTAGYTAAKEIQVSTPAEVNSEVHGVDLSKLTPAEIKEFKAALAKQTCSCGCGLTLLRCRETDPGCQTSLQKARAAYSKFLQSHPG
ncbi:MAG TPA: TlpA disulfide reductase family protein [Terriglobia bacterium]|nr:TlpA disulfide reductase family protein [Terriglobia bacterium]